MGGRAALVFAQAQVRKFSAATVVGEEVEGWLPRLATKKRLDGVLLMTAFHLLPVTWEESDVYAPFEAEARRRMARRDPHDWPTVALALAIEAPIWTQDKDFSVSGVTVYTTGQLLDALRERG
jgi:predicted nucleic acid-binding protein